MREPIPAQKAGRVVVAFRVSRDPIGGSTTLHFGLVLVERRFDGGFQSRSAKWLEHISKGAGTHSTFHGPVIGMRGEKDDRHMEVAADGDCGDDAINGSSEGDVHKHQIRPV
jgi:hypothetical protein